MCHGFVFLKFFFYYYYYLAFPFDDPLLCSTRGFCLIVFCFVFFPHPRWSCEILSLLFFFSFGDCDLFARTNWTANSQNHDLIMSWEKTSAQCQNIKEKQATNPRRGDWWGGHRACFHSCRPSPRLWMSDCRYNHELFNEQTRRLRSQAAPSSWNKRGFVDGDPSHPAGIQAGPPSHHHPGRIL